MNKYWRVMGVGKYHFRRGRGEKKDFDMKHRPLLPVKGQFHKTYKGPREV
jgi:hypothetical protein